MTKAQQQKLDELRRSDPFFSDDGFSPLDLSGTSLGWQLPLAKTEEDKFAPADDRSRDEEGLDLKSFLQRESVRADGPSRVGLGQGVSGFVQHDGKQWICAFEFQGKKLLTKSVTRDNCVMDAARHIANWKPDVRELTDTEMRTVAWLAQSGKVIEAATKFVELAIPKCRELGEREILTNPKYAEVLDDATMTAWAYGHNEYSLSDKDFPKFVQRFGRGKRLTLHLIDEAWKQYKSELAAEERERLLQPLSGNESAPGEVAAGLEEMSDEQINRAYQGVARELARR